jgi:hypothetical protein
MNERERQIYNALARIFAPYIRSVSQAIVNNQAFDISGLSPQVRRVLVMELEQIYLDTAGSLNLPGAPPVDLEELGTAAGEWARVNADDIEQGIDRVTRRQLGQAMQRYLDTPGMTRDDLEQMLRRTFGKKRAEKIAVTEVTRANAGAVNGLQDYYRQEYGLEYERIWQTSNDELTCPVCRPLNRKPERFWRVRFPGGPPAHPYCRCSLALRMVRNRQRRAA